jgi:glutamate-1-semialdehyde 2,1-aminomutase
MEITYMRMEPQSTERITTRSKELHREALEVFPGGFSHNSRATDYPTYIERSEGEYLYDVDGNKYLDFWNNHGASLLGHSPAPVADALHEQIEDGVHYGTVNEPALELGRMIQEFVPSAERIRFCCSGTEATMYAVRLARSFTGRDHVLKVEGGWHGGNTDLSIAVHPPFDSPTTHGLPPGPESHCHAFELNNKDSLVELLEEYRGEIAAVIIDPRKGGTPPEDEFLQFIDDAREDEGFQLIFDEVVTGCRVSPGSYQARADVSPDLTTLGKIIGGGLPVGALCGRAELFEPAKPDAAPDERVLAGGGTFSMNPMTCVAGRAALETIQNEGVFDHTESLGEYLRNELNDVFEETGSDGMVLGFSSMVLPVFNIGETPRSLTDVKERADGKLLKEFQHRLLDHGYYFNSGSMGNVSYAMNKEQIEGFVDASHEVVTSMQNEELI